jgi:hypothetical protein
MARISTYPKDTDISLTDKLLGTDAQGSFATKNFEISDFISFLAVNGPVGPTGPTGPTGPIGLVWRGDWSGDNEYLPTDAVSYQGSSYYCLNEILTSILPPPSDPTNWDLLAEKGDEGPQLPQTAYSIKANNTAVTAVPVVTTYRSPGLEELIEDPIFSDNQTPSGTVNKSYNWQQMGRLVTVTISVEYATWLVETGEWIRFNLPSDMPEPVVPTGFGGSGRVLYTGVGSAYETDSSITQTTGAQTMSLMRANGSSESLGFHFLIPYTIDALNPFKVFRMTLQYFTS